MLGGARQEVKKPFFPQKCSFRAENDIFSKMSFYSKLISDQNYMICTSRKIHFRNKIMIFQFSPDSTYWCDCGEVGFCRWIIYGKSSYDPMEDLPIFLTPATTRGPPRCSIPSPRHCSSSPAVLRMSGSRILHKPSGTHHIALPFRSMRKHYWWSGHERSNPAFML